MITALEMVRKMKATVKEIVSVADIPELGGVKNIHAHDAGAFKDVPVFTLVNASNVEDSLCGNPKAASGLKTLTIEQVKTKKWKMKVISGDENKNTVNVDPEKETLLEK
eukprot:gene9749-11553_t